MGGETVRAAETHLKFCKEQERLNGAPGKWTDDKADRKRQRRSIQNKGGNVWALHSNDQRLAKL